MIIEEAIKLLDEAFRLCDFTDAYGDMMDSDPYYEALDMAIKALELQTSDWKFYYNHGYAQARNDVLDEISAEIIELRSKQNVGVLECLDIIDKYKSEYEEE